MDSKTEAGYDEYLHYLTVRSEFFLMRENHARGESYAQLALALSCAIEAELVRESIESELDEETRKAVEKLMDRAKHLYETASVRTEDDDPKMYTSGAAHAVLAVTYAKRAKVKLECWKSRVKS
jgi:hypothetical protein